MAFLLVRLSMDNGYSKSIIRSEKRAQRGARKTGRQRAAGGTGQGYSAQRQGNKVHWLGSRGEGGKTAHGEESLEGRD